MANKTEKQLKPTHMKRQHKWVWLSNNLQLDVFIKRNEDDDGGRGENDISQVRDKSVIAAVKHDDAAVRATTTTTLPDCLWTRMRTELLLQPKQGYALLAKYLKSLTNLQMPEMLNLERCKHFLSSDI